ncbi:uncharacterized protein BDW43DRAFT_9826 [Aspergillus alliaceus]|uniref:uncharacterized protein n=1 Tax=Petromyces alliaceus TaxID=209559 RepID=UPI0012A6BEC7|nr:uncharacterized protein BDW43DRAFT_9826 [Aspergillus alliaceus]KAB8239664.1 hypothetical protein BDW43DRAFT_9826 [Aspergillus alliaceus]
MAIGQTSFFTGVVLLLNATIGRKLNTSSAEVTWITPGMSLTSGAFLLPFEKLSDLFGRKVLYISAMTGFTLTLVTIGFTPSAIYMEVFLGILGLFSAAVVPPATGGLGAVYKEPSKRKNRAFACLSAGNPPRIRVWDDNLRDRCSGRQLACLLLGSSGGVRRVHCAGIVECPLRAAK